MVSLLPSLSPPTTFLLPLPLPFLLWKDIIGKTILKWGGNQ